MILEDHHKHQPAEGGKVSERWVGKLSKRCFHNPLPSTCTSAENSCWQCPA